MKVCEQKLAQVCRDPKRRSPYGAFSLTPREFDYVFSDYPDVLNLGQPKESST
jgi:hypothetical protein